MGRPTPFKSQHRDSTSIVAAPVVIALVAVWATGCVTIGKFNLLKREVELQQQRLDNLNKKLYVESSKIQSLFGGKIENLKQINEQIQKISSEMSVKTGYNSSELQKLRGQLEEVVFLSRRASRDLTQIQDFLDERFGVNLGALPQGTPTTAQGMFQFGMRYLTSGKTREARRIFREFLNRYPKDEVLAPQAQFNIGESYFLEKKYNAAIAEYLAIDQQYRKSALLGKAVLRVAEAYEKQKDCRKAKKAYRLLRSMRKFMEATIAKERLKNFRQRCHR